jgi:hypothetical protein
VIGPPKGGRPGAASTVGPGAGPGGGVITGVCPASAAGAGETGRCFGDPSPEQASNSNDNRRAPRMTSFMVKPFASVGKSAERLADEPADPIPDALRQ